MIPENLSSYAIAKLLARVEYDSEAARVSKFRRYRDFFDGDIEMIEKHIKNIMTNSYFSEKTLENLRIQHRDLIQKIIRKKTSRIYDPKPKRYIQGVDDIKEILKHFQDGVQKALEESIFFNTVLVQPVMRDGELYLDTFTGESVAIITEDTDYLKPEKIFIEKAIGNELYTVVWTKEDHYLLDANGNELNSINGEELNNPYGDLPFAILRMREGKDFWGEPNNNIYQSQIEYDIKKTGQEFIKDFQSFGIYIATNLGLKEGDKLTPNKLINLTNVRTTEYATPGLSIVQPALNYEGMKGDLNNELITALMSEGLSAASGNAEVTEQSGISKAMDDEEVQGQRETIKNKLHTFELDLLEKCRMVYNKNGGNIPEGDFIIEFPKEKLYESVSDKIARRKHQKEMGIKNEIDFIMEDYDVEREKAIEIYQNKKEENRILGLGTNNLINSLRNRSATQNNNQL